MVTGTGGAALTARDSSTIHMTVLDGGAIAGAIDLAKSTRDLASKEFGQVLNSAQWFFENASKENAAAMKETLTSVGDVYQKARETELSKDVQGSKQLLQVVGFIVVGMVALAAFKKGGV